MKPFISVARTSCWLSLFLSPFNFILKLRFIFWTKEQKQLMLLYPCFSSCDSHLSLSVFASGSQFLWCLFLNLFASDSHLSLYVFASVSVFLWFSSFSLCVCICYCVLVIIIFLSMCLHLFLCSCNSYLSLHVFSSGSQF